MATPSSLKELQKQWLELDKNETTRDEIQQLINKNDTAELKRRLETRIAFGTAGLRARMQAGFSRLNALTIIQASQGLASYLLSASPTAKEAGVVIGHDHRHNSEDFARLTAATFVTFGLKVHYLEGLVHTPLVPFGVKHLGAAAGVMITASHNPAQDNGYKVYWSNASQIVPPHDKNIAQHISENLTPRDECWDKTIVEGNNPLVEMPVEKVREAYVRAVSELAPKLSGGDCPRFVYTAMHGVGLEILKPVIDNLGLSDKVLVLQEQAYPDPDFPTVKFPNPEEKGAMDLAMAKADEEGINLVIANDPDADRFAAAEKVNGSWKILSGNQLGVLFASYVLSTYATDGKNDVKKLAMLCTAVSTRMLSAMAEVEGFHFEETLTGFKWLGNAAQSLQSSPGYDALYAFEEAIGYMFTTVVPDKDGVSALAVFLNMLRSGVASPAAKLEQLYEKYGFFESYNSYLISPEPAVTTRVFEEIRGLGYGEPHPTAVGSRKITYWRDLTRGFDSKTVEGIPTLPVDKSSQMITCELEGGVKFTVRGSGTEPKIKLYVECKAPSREEAAKGAKEVFDDLVKEWFRPNDTGLMLG